MNRLLYSLAALAFAAAFASAADHTIHTFEKHHLDKHYWSEGANFGDLNKDGKPDGVLTYWYENGNMDSKISWRNGKLNGTISHWHENGVKSDSGFYKGGEEHGQYLQWHKNGKQSMVLLYDNGIEQERECYDEKGIECECDDFWGCK